MSAIGTKQTWASAVHMSAFESKQASVIRAALSQKSKNESTVIDAP